MLAEADVVPALAPEVRRAVLAVHGGVPCETYARLNGPADGPTDNPVRMLLVLHHRHEAINPQSVNHVVERVSESVFSRT